MAFGLGVLVGAIGMYGLLCLMAWIVRRHDRGVRRAI